MELITVVALMCKLSGAEPVCVEEIVTDSHLTPELTFRGCELHGQMGLAQWKVNHPIYSHERWYVGDYHCVHGSYEIKGRA